MSGKLSKPSIQGSSRKPSGASGQFRWLLRQQTGEQIRHLLRDLFDEVDDFIFTAGQKGQFGEIANYLQAMREIRAKRQEFEDRFLEVFDLRFLATGSEIVQASGSADISMDLAAESITSEQTELDLALISMRRKVSKRYSSLISQLGRHVNQVCEAQPIERDFLVNDVMFAFESTQNIFNISIDVKLVLFKLFETKILLKLEPVFLECIHRFGKSENQDTGIEVRIVESVDAAISDAGKKIINDQDLIELVALLSDSGASADDDDQLSAADSIAYYLNLVDSLGSGTALIYRQGKQEQVCVLQKSRTVENSYALNNRQGRLLLTRSRIGLAISMRAGELQTPNDYVRSSPREVSILESLSASGFALTIQ